jgi:plasmid stability protein
MERLIVRGLGPERAARHGRSAEGKYREMLEDAREPPRRSDFKALLERMPDAGEDEDFAVSLSDEELALVDEGDAAAARGELIDARSFLAQLRREG